MARQLLWKPKAIVWYEIDSAYLEDGYKANFRFFPEVIFKEYCKARKHPYTFRMKKDNCHEK